MRHFKVQYVLLMHYKLKIIKKIYDFCNKPHYSSKDNTIKNNNKFIKNIVRKKIFIKYFT